MNDPFTSSDEVKGSFTAPKPRGGSRAAGQWLTGPAFGSSTPVKISTNSSTPSASR